MTIEEKFIERWKELERVTSLSFPEWNGREIDKFLQKMQVESVNTSELWAWKNVRNALAHTPNFEDGKPIVTLDDRAVAFVEKVIKIVKKIPTAWNVAKPLDKVVTCRLDTPIDDVVTTMVKKAYSHVPVLDKGNRVIGVFSESTMMHMGRRIMGDNSVKVVGDFAKLIPICKHSVDRFEFVKKSEPLSRLRKLCSDMSQGKRLEMFFVTEDGDAVSPLLGIVTIWDFVGMTDSDAAKKASANG